MLIALFLPSLCSLGVTILLLVVLVVIFFLLAIVCSAVTFLLLLVFLLVESAHTKNFRMHSAVINML
jgi:hypothetical protein